MAEPRGVSGLLRTCQSNTGAKLDRNGDSDWVSGGGLAGAAHGRVVFHLSGGNFTLMLAWVYVLYGSLPQAASALYGMKAVMIAVVLRAIWTLSRTAVKSKLLMFIGAAAVVANGMGLNVLMVLFGAGIASIVVKKMNSFSRIQGSTALALPLTRDISKLMLATSFVGAPFGLFPLFGFFLKVGTLLFGSGYVLLAFLRTDLVVRLKWLTDKQLLDAIAVGQVTPGPVFTTATFIGYLLGRIPGALIATVGIFLPSFVFIAIIGPIAPQIRKSEILGAFLDGVNVGALALMVVVTWLLGRAALVDVTTIVLAIISAIALIRFKLNSTWLIAGGALVGYLAHGILG
jgi:chromate transporter